MQTLIGLAVSDASLLKAFAEGHRGALDVTATLDVSPSAAVPRLDAQSRGTWGVGFHSHGEMLVRKGPLATLRDGVAPHLRDIRARHVVLYAEAGDAGRTTKKLEDCSPLRYRDWLFAASGTDSLGPGFAEAVQAKLPTYAFSTRRYPSNDEALMMLAMSALEKKNARDTRDLTTRAIQKAVAQTADEVRALAPDANVLALLHVAGHLFAFGVGRDLYVQRFRGTGEPARAGRLPRHEHLRAIVLGDRTDDGAWEPIAPTLGVEVDASCELHTFPLS